MIIKDGCIILTHGRARVLLRMIFVLLVTLVLGIQTYSVSARGLIDPITDVLSYKRHADGRAMDLVMSDEFEEEGRCFEKGHDDFFESINQPDKTNQAMQYCMKYKSLLHFH